VKTLEQSSQISSFRSSCRHERISNVARSTGIIQSWVVAIDFKDESTVELKEQQKMKKEK